ncbi:MAG TPA: NAD(P)-dependent oxidoreductase [Burkholderiales bacterium]|nr:NAD(P)-dependent oxidoreductase [Burkholderiales bacterium]
MKVLVTGASGFVGVNLVEALRARDHEVVEFSVDKGGDVTDTAKLQAAMRGVDAVWHGAAITAGAEREKREAARIFEVNTLATLRALEAAAQAGVRRFIYPSSSAVYGETAFTGQGPVLEDEPLRPFNLYGISKVAAERAVLHLGPALGVEVAAGRINAVFGPGERDTGLRDTLSPHLQMIGMRREGREAVLARGAERDWIYAPDVADAFVRMLEAEKLPPVAMNITQGALWPLETMARALGVRWRYGETNLGYGGPIDRPRRPLSGKRIQELLGWSPAHTPETACSDYCGTFLR